MGGKGKGRMSVSIRLALVEKLRQVVSAEPSPLARLFDAKTASRAVICDCALELASWCVSGEFGKDLVEGYEPEFKQRILEVDQNAFARGVHETAKFLGATVEIDAERGVITVTPPAALEDDIGPGEIDSRPMVEPKIPKFH